MHGMSFGEGILSDPLLYASLQSTIRHYLSGYLHQFLVTYANGLFPVSLSLENMWHVLNVPCCSGDWVCDIAYQNPLMEVVGIDPDPRRIAFAQAQAEAQGYLPRVVPLAQVGEQFDRDHGEHDPGGEVLDRAAPARGWRAERRDRAAGHQRSDRDEGVSHGCSDRRGHDYPASGGGAGRQASASDANPVPRRISSIDEGSK